MSEKKGGEILDAQVPGVNVPYEWDAGECASKFYIKLRDEGKITATRCSKCDKNYLPPRSTCPECFDELDEWVEVETEGKLVTYTVVNYEEPIIQPIDPPIMYGVINLEGADTYFTHIIRNVDPENVETGMRLEAVLKDKSDREGNILDIKYFKPVD